MVAVYLSHFDRGCAADKRSFFPTPIKTSEGDMKQKANVLSRAVCAVAVITVFPVSAQETEVAARLAPDSNLVLATAPYKKGDGRIEIRRIIEEGGAAAIAIVNMAPIGTRYEPRRDWASLPLAEKVNMVYEDLTGQMLTREAYRALQELEELKIRNTALEAATDFADVEKPAPEPMLGCESVTPAGGGFLFDCKVYGAISQEESGTDDVCLLTAAIIGDHKMQISYKATNGSYHENFSGEVSQGHFVAARLLTGVKRTRRGQIYKADDSEYSRYSFDGDFEVEILPWVPVTDCQKLTSN